MRTLVISKRGWPLQRPLSSTPHLSLTPRFSEVAREAGGSGTRFNGFPEPRVKLREARPLRLLLGFGLAAAAIVGGQAQTPTADGFDPSSDGEVYALAVQGDGKILVGGRFSTLGGQTRNYLGRLDSGEPATESLTCDGSTLTWLRGGTSPEVWRTSFDYSTNGTDWLSLGAGTRIPGGWQLASLPALPTSTIRARGFVTCGEFNGSGSLVESTVAFVAPTPLAILINDGSFGFRTNEFGYQFGFNLAGMAGQTVVIEASTNLADWIPLATNTLGPGPLYFSDSDSTNFPARFYRARLGN